MLRILLILVAANLLAFLWVRGTLDSYLAGGRDPDRLSQQVEPDRLRIVPPERGTAAAGSRGPSSSADGAGGSAGSAAGRDLGAAGQPASGAAGPPASGAATPGPGGAPAGGSSTAGSSSSPATGSASGAASGSASGSLGPSGSSSGAPSGSSPGNEPASAAPGSTAGPGSPASQGSIPDSPLRRPGVVLGCSELTPLNRAKLARAREFFAGLPAYFEFESEVIEDSVSLLVYTLPVEDLAAAQKKLADFRRQGFEDIAIITEGPQRLGMSFGLYKTEPAARAMVENLTRRGVRNLRIVERDTSRGTLRYRYPLGENLMPRDVRDRLSALTAELSVASRACESQGTARSRS